MRGAWRVLALLALSGLAAAARADTPIALTQSFDGRMNFTGTQLTLRTKVNDKNACSVSSSTSNRTASLALPLGATVKSAQLYWAGSGALDDTVSFEGRTVTATRRYTSATVGGGFNYFGGAADVTAAVQAKGSGKYTFSGLTVSTGNPWCASQAVLGGFSLLVIYSHPTEPERVLNLYEGFRFAQNSELVVTASNFRWPRHAFPVRERARVGHITWEGDITLAQDGERLLFEGEEMTDSMNPEGNQFNSKSSINGDDASYGIDFDAFDTSVVIWSGYEPKVTTSYRTGQDLVLLNAEILVLPTMPVSDLSIALARSGEVRAGMFASYAVTVANNGPYTEPGPVTVTTTLPDGLAYTSSAGSGWACAAAGAAVTCSYNTALAPGYKAPGLTINTAIKSAGDKAVTVTVKGTDDDNASNNTATNTFTALPGDVSNNPTPGDLPGVAKYVFTSAACKDGVKVETADGAACRYYGSTVAAGAGATVFVTAIDGAGNAIAAPKSVPMKFALRCLNPAKTAGVGARVGAATLPACAPATEKSLDNSRWSGEVAVAFADGAASAPLAFSYADVGQVELMALGNGAVGTPAGFVVKPWKVDFRGISRAADGLPAPVAVTPEGASFARAGEALLVEIGARVFDAAGNTVWAPNFGNETTPPVPTLGNTALYTDASSKAHLPKSPPLTIDEQTRKAGSGTVSVQASWGETGATRFVTGLESYLDKGDIGASGKDVGRFQPAFFTTEIAEPFACAPGITCAVRDNNDQIGMVYSGQPLPVKVVARGMQDQELGNFNGDWFRPIALSMAGPAGAAVAGNFAPAELATSPSGSLVYTLPAKYSADAHRAGGWTAPTTVYLRARAEDTRLVASGTQSAPVLSDRAPVASDEDGVVVINGRLRVANALGTDTLRTPLGLRAEYWTGAAWLGHAAYADAAGVNAALAQFPACTRSFVGKDTPCDPALAGVGAPAIIKLAQGAGTLWLRAPGKQADGRSRDGSISVRFPGWAWLPSTPARVTFGRHRSPVIYLREMY